MPSTKQTESTFQPNAFRCRVSVITKSSSVSAGTYNSLVGVCCSVPEGGGGGLIRLGLCLAWQADHI